MVARVREILGGTVDAVFDGTGNPAVIQSAWSVTSPKGRVVLVGVMPSDRALSLNTLPLHYGKRLIGSEGGSSRPAEDILRIIRILKGRNISAGKMVSHRVEFIEINKAVSGMRAGDTIHSILGFVQ